MYSNGERKWRNSKLESFLRRNLKNQIYSDIRWHEPVVSRRGTTLEYKHVVVTGSEVLMVDTQPRAVSSLLSVRNILSVLLVHDLPQFLEGGLRHRTTHIVLKVRKSSSRGLCAGESTPSSVDEELLFSDGQASNSVNEEPGSLTQVQVGPGSLSQVQEEPGSLPQVQEEPGLLKALVKARKNPLMRCNSDSLWSSNRNHFKNGPSINRNNSRPPLARGLGSDEGQHWQKEARHSLGDASLGSEDMVSPLLSARTPHALQRSISPALCDVLHRVDGDRICRASTPDILSAYRPMIPRSVSALDCHQPTPKKSYHLSSRSKSVLDKPSEIYSIPFVRRKHSTSSELKVDDEEEIHLYSMSTSTHLYHLLQSLWMASLLTPLCTGLKTAAGEHDDEYYGKLLKDICFALEKQLSVEEELKLFQEMRTGMTLYPNLGKLFWKDLGSLDLVRSRIRRFCTKSHSFSFLEDNSEKRKNELTLIVLAFQLLHSSLAHSQGCPHRAKAFRSKSMVEGLLKEIFSPPELPAAHKLTCSRFLEDFKQLSTMNWQLLPEREVIGLVQRVTDASVEVAFHAFEAIFEIRGWSSTSEKAEEESLTLHMLLQHVPTEKWLSLAIPRLFFLIHTTPRNKEDGGGLTHNEVLLIYQYLSVFLSLFKQSPRSLAYAIRNFSDEIRYYIDETALRRKIEPDHQLRPHTLRLAHSIARCFYSDRTRRKKSPL